MMHPDWRGWHFAGRHLVTPHRDRVTAETLAHLVHMHRVRLHFESGAGLATQAARARAKREKRLQGAQVAVKVIVVDLGAWKTRHGLGCA